MVPHQDKEKRESEQADNGPYGKKHGGVVNQWGGEFFAFVKKDPDDYKEHEKKGHAGD